MPASPYPFRFASPARDCAQTETLPRLGELTWSVELGLSGARTQPCLLPWGDVVVAVSAFGLAAFGKDGQRRWERRRQAGGAVAIVDDRLYHQSPELGLDAVDAANTVALDSVPMPGVANERFLVTLLAPGADEFVMASVLPAANPEPEDLDGPQPEPLISARRTAYGQSMAQMSADMSGFSELPLLYVSATHSLVIGFNPAQILDVQAGLPGPTLGQDDAGPPSLPSFPLPLQTHVDWSADPEGGLVVTGYDAEDRKVIVGLNPAGEELWRWVDEAGTDRWVPDQPPIRAPGGRVYALTEGRVLAFEQDTLRWSFDALSDSLRHGARLDGGSFELVDGVLHSTEKLRHATSLGDGSLLVCGGRNLRHLSPDGIKLGGLTLREEILTPPVVDEEGALYLATANNLLRFG